MKRQVNPSNNGKISIPDAINKSKSRNFTQIPNEFLRNPDISAKAKTVLSILLSNSEGWTSYFSTLQKMMKEGEDAIKSALVELQNHGYLMKLKYRDKNSKHIRGSVWVYSDEPGEFPELEKTEKILNQYNMEFLPYDTENFQEGEFHQCGNHPGGNHSGGNQELRILRKEYKYKNKKSSSRILDAITPSQFDEFWELYPRKEDKGRAQTSWEKICNKPPENRPSFQTLMNALRAQRETDRWKDKKFIPHPATWLNQKRWLDDPEQMVDYSKSKKKPSSFNEDPDETDLRWRNSQKNR